MDKRSKWIRNRPKTDERLLNGILSRAMVVMSPIQYDYFSLYHRDRLTVTEIAKRYGVSASNVSSTIHRAEKRMIENWG